MGRINMLRILCIVASMDAGGAETFLMKIFRNVDKNQIEMDFCVGTKRKGYYNDEILSNGGKIFYVTMKSKNFFVFCKDLISLLQNKHYDCVIRIGASSLTAIELWIAKICGVPCRILRSSNAGTLIDQGIHGIIHTILRVPLTSAATVKIAPSYLAGEYTFGKRIAKKDLIILKNGLTIKDFTFSEEWRKQIRKDFGIKNEIVVGHVGRFNRQKNHDYLLDVFKEFSKSKENVVLLLVGIGELEIQIQEKARKLDLLDKIIFTGVRSDVSHLLMAMDILVFPSIYEGMPNVVIEAQCTGLPCVISDSITHEVKITDLVTMESIHDAPSKWSASISQSLEKKRDRKKYAEQMQRNGYDIKDVVNQFVSLARGSFNDN